MLRGNMHYMYHGIDLVVTYDAHPWALGHYGVAGSQRLLPVGEGDYCVWRFRST